MCVKQSVISFRAKFHRDCAAKAAPACGLPSEYVDLVIDLLKDGKCDNCVKKKSVKIWTLSNDNTFATCAIKPCI